MLIRTSVNLVALSLVLVGCSPEGEAAGEDPTTTSAEDPSTATYSANGVAFEYPASWASLGEAGPEGTAWEWRSGPPAGTAGFVEVVAFQAGAELTGEQLKEFGERFFRYVENEALGDERQGETVRTAVGGELAFEARFARANGDENRALAFAHGTIAYGLDCFLPSDDVGAVAGCEQVISSFRFDG